MVIAGTARCRGSNGRNRSDRFTRANWPNRSYWRNWPHRSHRAYGCDWSNRCSRCARPPVTFRGTWSSSTTYTIGDAVFESGTSYIAVVSNTAVDPATNVSGSGGIWAVLARAGSSSTVSVGTTTTGASGTSAVVTNSGTSSAAVLNFTIPQGPAGATG